MSTPTKKTFGEFFAGIGLMRIGLERAGWRIAFANDIDEDKQRMYRDHFGDSEEFVLGDVHKLDASQIPDISLATASFPCNDLSLAGARRGLDIQPVQSLDAPELALYLRHRRADFNEKARIVAEVGHGLAPGLGCGFAHRVCSGGYCALE